MSLFTSSLNPAQRRYINQGDYYRGISHAYYLKAKYPNASSVSLMNGGAYIQELEELQGKSMLVGATVGGLVGFVLSGLAKTKVFRSGQFTRAALTHIGISVTGALIGYLLPTLVRLPKTLKRLYDFKCENQTMVTGRPITKAGLYYN